MIWDPKSLQKERIPVVLRPAARPRYGRKCSTRADRDVTCSACGLIILQGEEVAEVKAMFYDGPDSHWHPDCWKLAYPGYASLYFSNWWPK